MTIFIDNVLSKFLGRPKCEINIIALLFFKSNSIVGIDNKILELSVTMFLSIGTLKSTRTKTLEFLGKYFFFR